MVVNVRLFACGFLWCVYLTITVAGAKIEDSIDNARAMPLWNKLSQNQLGDEFQERKLDDYPRQYILWKPEEIKSKLFEWKSLYPNLVRVTTSQQSFGLPRAGGESDCPFDEGGDGCLNYVITIQDFVAHPEGSDSSNHLPEVFWSGVFMETNASDLRQLWRPQLFCWKQHRAREDHRSPYHQTK
ncbi:Zinc carboxypeptidase [Fragilaria crotonensis]|nr:Zinc carboxypeptidase [Fragilaria crotonensis]